MNIIQLEEHKDIYLRMSDPTEYYFATKVIGSWSLWEDICNDPNLKTTVALWRRELEAKIKSDSLARIIDAAKGETRDALQANKFLLDTPWVEESSKRGRPSKNDILAEANKIALNEQRLTEDYRRVFSE